MKLLDNDEKLSNLINWNLINIISRKLEMWKFMYSYVKNTIILTIQRLKSQKYKKSHFLIFFYTFYVLLGLLIDKY